MLGAVAGSLVATEARQDWHNFTTKADRSIQLRLLNLDGHGPALTTGLHANHRFPILHRPHDSVVNYYQCRVGWRQLGGSAQVPGAAIRVGTENAHKLLGARSIEDYLRRIDGQRFQG